MDLIRIVIFYFFFNDEVVLIDIGYDGWLG